MKQQPMRVFLQDIPIDLIDRAQLVERITGWLRHPEQHHQVVTLNALMLVKSNQEQLLQQIIREASLVMVDGFGIELLLRHRGYQTVSRLAGVDLVRLLIAWCAEHAVPVACFGGPAQLPPMLGQALAKQWPSLNIGGLWDGSDWQRRQAAIVAALKQGGPCLLLAGLGTPAQEIFLARALPDLPGTVGIGVGGALEVIAGVKKEAPPLIRHGGWEWAYRMIREPERLKNIPKLIRFWARYFVWERSR